MEVRAMTMQNAIITLVRTLVFAKMALQEMEQFVWVRNMFLSSLLVSVSFFVFFFLLFKVNIFICCLVNAPGVSLFKRISRRWKSLHR